MLKELLKKRNFKNMIGKLGNGREVCTKIAGVPRKQ